MLRMRPLAGVGVQVPPPPPPLPWLLLLVLGLVGLTVVIFIFRDGFWKYLVHWMAAYQKILTILPCPGQTGVILVLPREEGLKIERRRSSVEIENSRQSQQ